MLALQRQTLPTHPLNSSLSAFFGERRTELVRWPLLSDSVIVPHVVPTKWSWCLVAPHFCRALIADNAVAKVDLSGDSGFNEQLHGAVDGGMADLQVPSMQDKEKLINIKLAVEIDELIKNDIALLAGIDPSVGQVLSEDFFRVLHHETSLFEGMPPTNALNYNDIHFQHYPANR